MSKVAEEKAAIVATAKTDCEELLVEIVQDKRVADEQEKQVGAAHRSSCKGCMLQPLRP
jgi:dynein heavy chain